MRRILMVLFLTVLAIAGCSGGGNPVTTVSDERAMTPNGSVNSLPIIDVATYEDGSFNALGVMGAYELIINPATMTADLVSKRMPSLGQSWTVSGMAFFAVAPCSDCLKLDSIALTVENYLQIHFAISHPFDKGSSGLPPSAKNRLDLDVFDLAAVIAPVGATPVNYALMGTKAYTGILAKNAGLTTELKNVTTDPAAMPYVLVVDDNAAAKDTWNKFAMGTDSFFDIYFNLNTVTTLTYDMYLTMGYGASAVKKTRLTPTYFNPEFNRKQAWKVVVTPPQGSDPPAMGNTWNDNDPTGTFNVKVEVFDWQQGVTTIAKPPVLPGDIAYASNVSMVKVEIPGMKTTLPSVTTPTGGTGEPDNPLVFQVPIANQNLLDAGEYLGLVKVSDQRVPTTTPPGADGIDYMIHTENGIVLTNYAIPEYATYQTFIATVVVGCGPITGSITSPSCPVTGQQDGASIDFTVTASSGNGGDPIVEYACDYDYNGTTFTADFTNTDGNFVGVGPFTVPDCPSNVPRDFTVAFRAKDSCPVQNVTIFATCKVTVETCCPDPDTTQVTTSYGVNQALAQAYTGVVLDGSNYNGSTATVKFIGTSTFTATNVVSNGSNQITCDVDFTGALAEKFDVQVKNECGSTGTEVDLFEVICPGPIYTTSFDPSDPDQGNWITDGLGYWRCNWWQGQINSRDGGCYNSNYCPCHYPGYSPGYDYCGRAIGFTVPACWPTSDTIELHVTWEHTKQCAVGCIWDQVLLYYDWTGNPPPNGTMGQLYYNCTNYPFSIRTDVFNLSSLGLNAGGTIWLWFTYETWQCSEISDLIVYDVWID